VLHSKSDNESKEIIIDENSIEENNDDESGQRKEMIRNFNNGI
jgi:hypothetical protein